MPAYKDKKGKWFSQYSVKMPNGKFKGVTKRGFETKREALDWENDERRKAKGTLDMPFKDFVQLYYEYIQNRIKVSTLYMKKNIIETHIVPYFKNKSVNQIEVKDIIDWQNYIIKNNGFKKSYLKTLHSQLTAILNHAVRFYKLSSNPAIQVGNMGTNKEIKMQFWTKEEYEKFSEVMKDDPMYYYIFQCLYYLGLREGELLAVEATDIDFVKKEFNVSKTYYRLNGKEFVTSPKTPQSNRKISIPDFLCDELKDYLKLVYEPVDGCNRIFPTNKSTLNKKLKKGAKLAGVKQIRVHDLRHSHVSLLVELGFSISAIAERCGHSSSDITFRYAHLFPNTQNKIASKLNEINKEEEDDDVNTRQ